MIVHNFGVIDFLIGIVMVGLVKSFSGPNSVLSVYHMGNLYIANVAFCI